MGFADYMRAMRDGRTLVYDQEPPPSEGTRPATEAVVGGEALRADGMTLLADIEEIAVADAWSDLAGPPPPHVHERHVESFYVLKGELALTAGGREHRAPAGSWVQVPPGRAARRLVFRAGASSACTRRAAASAPSCARSRRPATKHRGDARRLRPAAGP